MRLRVAVVGAGFMGQLHARVISESPLAELAAIVDVDRDTAERLASSFGVSEPNASALPESCSREAVSC